MVAAVLNIHIASNIKEQKKGEVVPMLNQAPRHDQVWWSEGVAPRTLDLGTSWK